MVKEIPTEHEWGKNKLCASEESIPLARLYLESVDGAMIQGQNRKESIYPFKIWHLGEKLKRYTLGAFSVIERANWCQTIVEMKTKQARALSLRIAEPFRLRVLSATFDFDVRQNSTITTLIYGTPLSRALQELERFFGPDHPSRMSHKAQVNCSTGFTVSGEHLPAVGTDSGIFCASVWRPRELVKTLDIPRVTQITVLEEFSVCLIITDRDLVSFPLGSICPPTMVPDLRNKPAQRAVERIAKDVTYFTTTKMKERLLLFYDRSEFLRTSFKVIELVPIQSSETMSRVSRLFTRRRKGNGSIFREFDEFKFPQRCYSLGLFQTNIADPTALGVELLTLDQKQPVSVPNLSPPELAGLANRIRNQRPLEMFRLNAREFTIAYDKCAVFMGEHGNISRSLILDYTGTQAAHGAIMYNKYLLLFYDDYVEVRDPENERFRQIIPGHDIRVLDYGVRGPRSDISLNPQGAASASSDNNGFRGTVKIAMNHPELAGRRLILEMLLNDR